MKRNSGLKKGGGAETSGVGFQNSHSIQRAPKLGMGSVRHSFLIHLLLGPF